MDMECDTARLAISSAIDDGVVVSDEIEQHVSVCAACQQWREGVHQLRRTTLRTVSGAPSAAIAVSELPRRFTMHRWIRFALAWAGALLVVWNAVDMFSAGSGLSIHFERHQAAFDVALGLAFLFVAWRSDRAYGMVPFAAAFAIALTLSAVIDLANGASTFDRESAHLIEILGLALLWALGLAVGPGRKRHGKDPGSG